MVAEEYKLPHRVVDYGRGGKLEYCRTCKYSDHKSPPTCEWVKAIEPGGWCKLWKAMT